MRHVADRSRVAAGLVTGPGSVKLLVDLSRVRARQLLADAAEHLGIGLQVGMADLAVQLDNLLHLGDCPAELALARWIIATL